VADEIDPDSSPSRYNASYDAQPAVCDHGLRRFWDSFPAGPRVAIPIALLLVVVVVGCYAWMKPSRDDWSHVPSGLVCQVQSGLTPPPSVLWPQSTPRRKPERPMPDRS
jgi:hypothetical protein